MSIGESILSLPVRNKNELSTKDFLQEFYLMFDKMNFPESLIEKNKNKFIGESTLRNSNTFQNYSEPFIETRTLIEVEPVKKYDTINLIPMKYRKSEKLDIDEMYYKQETIFEWEISDLTFHEINTIMNFLKNNFYKIDLISKQNILLSELSFGEKQLIFVLNKIYRLALNTNEDNLILLLDEIDIGFHPNWQKRTIQYVIDFLSLIPDKNFHLIFTTHSPFLLSDLPKENIIFLKDGKNDKGINYKQTFGANIHTLLSDSFFMEDGLMGEFAKNKIQEIMDFLNDKKSIEKISTKEEQIKQVIETIGEPFLKQKLLEMYYKKFKDEASKKARKDELLAEQKRINRELEKYD